MQNPYLNVHRIEFAVTWHCTGRCRHCSVAEMIENPGAISHVDTDAAVDTVSWLADHFPVSSVMTFGGEPLLYPETVCAIHRTAAARGIETRQLITNGYFSNDPDIIRQVAFDLKAAGVNNLLLSADSFHQEKIPLEPVYDFARCVLEGGISHIRLSPAWLVNENHDNAYNAQTRAVLARFSPLKIPVGHGNNIFLAGNAARYLRDYYPPSPVDLSASCGSMPYTEPLTQATSISIEPNGDVVVCAFVIGNIYRESIADIVSRYDPYAHEGMRAVVTGGVPALMALAQEKGLDISCENECSACRICQKIARELAEN